MPTFRYKGYKSDGAEASGAIEADGLKDAVSKVRESGLFPKEVKEDIQGSGIFSKKYDAAFLPAITRQLSVLFLSGVTLIDALKSLADENKGSWGKILKEIRKTITEGSSLSRAISEHKAVFPEFYVNMIAAGEASGNLGQALSRLAEFLEKQEAVKQKIRTAMIYPLFMISVGLVVLSFLFVFVIPKIARIFEDTGSSLPFITIILIKVSNFLRDYWWLTAALIGSGIFGFKRFGERNPLLIDRVKMKMPGGIIQHLYYARFARTLGFLLEGGLPVLRALELSSNAIGNKSLEEKVSEAGRRIAEGASLSASLDGFPPVLLLLISTGEKTGRMTEVLNRAADSYEEEFSRRVQRALSLLEPSMILVMGLVVGFIVFAVLLPMFQMNQLIK